jgi:hypothetical protein
MRTRLYICSFLISVTLVSSGAVVGAAEPTVACRILASRFGAAVAELDARSLVNLGICVAVELGERAGAAEPPALTPGDTTSPSIPPAVVTPSEAPIESSISRPPGKYGEWHPSALWREAWPEPGPWEGR